MATYRELFAFREFRYLYGGQVLSYLGDQLGAVAIVVLVYDRTGSSSLAAIAYAASWLPGVFGGPILAVYADRLSRRGVLIVCDIARALLVALLGLPGMPVWAAIALLYVAHLWSPPFVAARSALMPEVLPGEAYILGNGLSNVTSQICQVAGFALGGVVVAATGPTVALLVNAATFALSAALIAAGVGPRPVPKQQQQTNVWQDFRDGARYIANDSWMRACLLLVWTSSAFSFAIEGVAYPLAVQLGGGATTAGVLLAIPGVGFAAGAVVLTRGLTPQRREQLLPAAALLSVVALIPIMFAPNLPVVVILLITMGAGASFSAPLNAMFVRRVAPGYRGRAMGLAMSGLLAVQGGGFLVAGVAVDAGLTPSSVVGWSGMTGSGVVLATILHWRRVRNETAGPAVTAADTELRDAAIVPKPGKADSRLQSLRQDK